MKRIVAFVILVLLLLHISIRSGFLGRFMATPGDLGVNASIIAVNGTSNFLIEWDIERKPIERLLAGNDAVFVFYPVKIRLLDESWPIISDLFRPAVAIDDGGWKRTYDFGYNVWYYPTPGFNTPRVMMAKLVYFVPRNVDRGKVEIPISPSNISECSTIPVIFAYFHDNGGGEVVPGYVELRPKLYLGPNYPVFGSGELEVLFEFNFSRYIEHSGGWVEVRTLNVTLPCGGT
ncbi:hypothetical protein [Thermococcus sp.]|uniref:hypothetical protein n=1 Tax=Thermococcus sp. TaxID=35749 RepID=UPI0025EA7740|nr:hypothetical protein [Thermococcus sp.]